MRTNETQLNCFDDWTMFIYNTAQLLVFEYQHFSSILFPYQLNGVLTIHCESIRFEDRQLCLLQMGTFFLNS